MDGVNLTTADLVASINQLKSFITQPSTIFTLAQQGAEQATNEARFAANGSTCHIDVLQKLHQRAGALDADQLNQLVQNQFYDASVMEATMCIASSIVETAPDQHLGMAPHNQVIKDYITNLRQIGAESANGYALSAGLEQTPNFMVVKVGRQAELNASLDHEFVLGTWGTNRLRSISPAFSYVYGKVTCSPPLINPETKEVATWCRTDANAVTYVLYENVAPAVTSRDYVATCTGGQFLNVYLQICNASRLAKAAIDWTHYDLHDENVLLRSVVDKPLFRLPFMKINGLDHYLEADRVATIIDFGTSFGRLPSPAGPIPCGAPYIRGVQTSQQLNALIYGQSAVESYIYHDLYKFLMFSVRNALAAQNYGILEVARKIFYFFNKTEALEEAVVAQQNTYYALPVVDALKNLPVETFIQYILHHCECPFIQPEGASASPILSCEEFCKTRDTVYQEVGLNLEQPPIVPTTIMDFYNMALDFQNQGLDDAKRDLFDRFPYEAALAIHVQRMNQLQEEIYQVMAKNINIDVGPLSQGQLFTPGTLSQTRNMYLTLAQVEELATSYAYHHKLGVYVADATGHPADVEMLNAMNDQFTVTTGRYIADLRNRIIANETALDAKRSLMAGNAIGHNLVYSWYWNGRRNFDLATDRPLARGGVRSI